jgi:hypothetical protein
MKILNGSINGIGNITQGMQLGGTTMEIKVILKYFYID